MSRYPTLLSPLRIGNVIIKNRMLSSFNLPKYMQGPEAYPSENYSAFFSNIARNGAGIVDVETWERYPQQRNGPLTSPHTHMPAFDLTNPATLNYVSELAEEVHLYGSKIIIGVGPGHALGGGPGDPLSRSPEELDAAVERYVELVQLYVDCGFDGVADRIDYYLVPMFSDGSYERGRSVQERTEFSLRCFRRLKEVFGKDFLIEGVISGEQPHGYIGKSDTGYTLDEFVEYAKLAEGAIDILQIRNDCMITVHPTGFTFRKGEHPNLAYCRALREAGVRSLLMPIGGFQDPEEMEQLLKSGQCDMIGMARAFMADYDFVQKIEEGRGEDIRPCIWCNSCHGPTTDKNGPWVNRCTVNPELGFEARLGRLVRQPGAPKKLAVIGGGTAGMQAAITAAERGHSVTLYEARDYLGGQLIHAESFSFKWPLRDFKNWQIRRLEQLGVDVHLNTRATPELIQAGGYDAVFAATGAVPVYPASIQGLLDAGSAPLYPTCHDVFGREAALGKHVIIVGGSETGMETALYLLENGHDVTMLTRQEKVAHDASKSHYITLTWMDTRRGDGRADEAPEWTKYDNFTGITRVTTTRVDGNTVWYTDADGNAHSLTADSIVICGGMAPLQDEALSFSGTADRFYVIGDANGVGNVQKCIREGWSRANLL